MSQADAVMMAPTAGPSSAPTQKSDIGTALLSNLRNYIMIIMLAIIVLIFTIWSKGLFLSPYNITNLINQTTVIAVMTGGMTLIIIIRQIDLSVGFLSGFLGAITGLMIMKANVPWPLTILLVLIFGAAIGLVLGLLVGKVGVPAFVVTLGMMIVAHGLMILALRKTNTLVINKDGFTNLYNGFIPALGHIPLGENLGQLCISTVVICLIGIAAFIFMQISGRRRQQRYHFAVTPLVVFVVQTAIVSVFIAALGFQLARDHGISWALVILGVVVAIMSTVQSRTRFGRYVYGVGGNPEASELSGVSVAMIMIICFVIMEVLTALSGILYAARMKSAAPTAGTGFELLVIAGCFIGGCSPYGGVGRVVGSLVGALIMQSLVNGMLLMTLDSSIQYIVQGTILVVAVLFDILSRKATASVS